MADICESLCEAVKIIIEGEQNKNPLTFDITKDCTVVGTKNKSKGRYDVSDGSSTFEAYATANNTYALGDNVLVTIPQGDYNNQKTILNRIVSDAVDAIGYVSPMDTFINGTGNLIKTFETQGIIANGDKAIKEIWSLTKTDGLYFGFTRIALSAEFMTLFSPGIIKGEYGLKLFVYGTKSKDQVNNPVAELTFSSSEMLGNIYSFNSFFKQEIVFTIPSNINSIEKIKLCLYQDGQFNMTDISEVSNILVKNIEVYLGYQGSYTTQELVELACADLTFDKNSISRQLALRWLHKIDEGVFEPISINNFNSQKHEVRWYHHVSGCADADTDEYGGKNWQWLNPPGRFTDSSPFDYPFVLPVELDLRKTTEKFKVVTLLKENPLVNDPTYVEIKNYTSNILEFENVDESSGGGTISEAEQIKKELSLHFHDNSYGNYFLYDQNGVLTDSANEGSSKKRSIEIYHYDEPISQSEEYNNIDWIKWEVPAHSANTMIQYSTSGSLDIKNPEENILPSNYSLGNKIFYSNTGEFEYSFKLIADPADESKSFKTVKMFIYTTTKETVDDLAKNDSWDSVGNRPYTHVFSGLTKNNIYSKKFTINREYKYFKIIHKYYDSDDEEVTFESSPVSDLMFKLSSTFHTGTSTPTTDDKGKRQINTLFEYSILNNWNQSRNNNTIKCTISRNGQEIVLTETLRFGKKGTSGTSRTFLLEMLNGKNALVIDDEDKILRIEALLVDSNGKLISLAEAAKDNKIEFELINNDQEYVILTQESQSKIGKDGNVEKDEDGNEIKEYFPSVCLSIAETVTELPKDNYVILQAKYTYPVEDAASQKTPALYAFLPIPMKTKDCIGMSGPDRVIYNHMGTPSCGDDGYVAFSSDEEEYDWQLEQKNTNPNPLNLTSSPSATIGANKTLLPSPLYSSKDSTGSDSIYIYDAACVSCSIWSQPILIMQSQYDFAMLNSWDGSLTIDEENGTILATMLGAGKKDDDNKFSGVLIGDIQGGTGLQDTTALTGVYGFQDGIITYGLQENGTAFFGAKTNGRIEINGQHGAIHSYGWTPTYEDGYTQWTLASGLKGSVFDLDDGQLQLYTNANNYFKYNANNSGKLEMALSGASIQLTDKSDSLTSFIDVSAGNIISEVRRSATYFGISNTDRKTSEPSSSSKADIRDVSLTMDIGNNSSQNHGNQVKNINIKDILKTGVTIAVKFEKASSAIKENQITDNDTIKEITKNGYPLSLKIKDQTRPVYLNGTLIGWNNPFEWSANSTIHFVYNEDDNGYWTVTDSGSYSRITQTANEIRQQVSDVSGNLSASIQLTKENIEAEVKRTGGYSATCPTGASTSIKNISLSQGVLFEDKNIFYSGVTIAVTFTYANSAGLIYLNITGTSLDKHGSNNGLPVHINNKITADDNKVEWNEGSTIYFSFVRDNNNETDFGHWNVVDSGAYSKITQTADAIIQTVENAVGENGTLTIAVNAITQRVEDAEGDIATLSTNTEGITGTAINRGDNSFTFNLTSSGFYLNNANEANASNYKFKCDKDGIYINGGGTFSGSLSADTTKFKKLETGAVKIAGTNYYSSFANGEIQLVVGTEDQEGTTNGHGGYFKVGPANETVYDQYWDDITIWGQVIKEDLPQTGYGNIGTPSRQWSWLYVAHDGSQRNMKRNIQRYDSEQAYEELRHLPLYTYQYIGDSDHTRSLFLGSMIDYMPIEFMRTTPEKDGTIFEPNNIIFWNIAASQTIQSKLEDLINRVEQLEQKEV